MYDYATGTDSLKICVRFITRRAVIPHDNVSRLPHVCPYKLWLGHVFTQRSQQGCAVTRAKTNDSLGKERRDKKRFASALGMSAYSIVIVPGFGI